MQHLISKKWLLVSAALIIMFVTHPPQDSSSQENLPSIDSLHMVVVEVNGLKREAQALSGKKDKLFKSAIEVAALSQEIDSMIMVLALRKAAIYRKPSVKYLPPVIIRDTIYEERHIPVTDVWVFDAPKYGGDSKDIQRWKAPGDDGLIKQIFKKKNKKQ